MIINFNQIMFNLARGYYRCIGAGSSRQVFDLENGYVIKAAMNEAGLAQNKSEYEISAYDNSYLFAKVIQVSGDYRLLIMEKARKIKNISYVWEYFNVSGKKELFNSKEMQKIKNNYDLLLGDFDRKSNWGIINGRPVIIDYGFTREVKARYY